MIFEYIDQLNLIAFFIHSDRFKKRNLSSCLLPAPKMHQHLIVNASDRVGCKPASIVRFKRIRCFQKSIYKAYGPNNAYDPNNAYKYELRPKSEFHPQETLLALRPCMGCLGCPFQVIRLDLLPIPPRQDGAPGPTGTKASLCIACAKTVQQSHDKGKKDAQIVGSLASLSYLCSNFAAHP